MTPSASQLRILEIAQGVSGPLCGRLFAGFGHDVLKCEPPDGDRQRTAEPRSADGMSFSFAVLNEAKRGVGVDLADPAAQAHVAGLIDDADVVICDLTVAQARDIGWDETAISARWPSLVWVWVTGFGQDFYDADQLAGLPDDSLLAESFAGLAYVIGDPDRQPLALGGEQAAYAAGFAAYLAARLALLRRDAEGIGEIVDVASTDVAAFMDWKSDVSFAAAGDVPVRNATTSWWRVLPAADGFIGLIYHDRDWPKLARLTGDERLTDPRFATAKGRIAAMDEWLPIVAEWIRQRPARAVYEAAQRLGLPFGYDADMADLAADPQYQERGFIGGHGDRGSDRSGSAPGIGPPWHMDGADWHRGALPVPARTAHWLDRAEPGPRAALLHAPRAAPLEGVLVLDLGTITAGAATGRMLADYGATVIKVENPQHPDPFRHWAAANGELTGESPLFEANNAGKLGVALDLKAAEGRAALLRLVASAQVLVDNYRVGVTERLGISFDELRKANPGLIQLSLSSQGQDGPQARYSSYGSTLDLVSGLSSVTGYSDGPPVWSSYLVNYPDQLASLVGTALVVHCVAEQLTGVHIDLSQRELVSWTLADLLADQLVTGHTARRAGNRRHGIVPHDAYPCRGADRWVAISCSSDAQRAALAAILGATPDWADPGSADAVVSTWTSARTREECVAALRAAGVPSVPVLDARDRADEAHFIRRQVFIDGPTGLRTRGFPFVLRRYAPPAPGRAPAVGEHNALLLQPTRTS